MVFKINGHKTPKGDTMEMNLNGIILAAGKSTRCNSGRTKLAERICGQKMILYPTKLFEELHIPTIVVVGHQKEYITDIISKNHKNNITFVTQEKQLGTGDAVACTKQFWQQDHLIIMNGDMPLVTKDIIEDLYNKHITSKAAISFVIAHNPDPTSGSYGRIMKNNGHIKIIESKDFTGDMHEHCCVNAGIYILSKKFLTEHIKKLTNLNASKEFYLTDLIKIASEKKLIVTTVTAPFDQIRGINTYQELWAAEQIKRSELIKYWMDHGVRFSVAQNVHIDLNVSIGAGSYIGCGVHLMGNTIIGKNCKIHEFSSIDNTTLKDDVIIYAHCIVKDTHIETHTHIGPYAHISEQTTIGAHTTIGNFVEITKSTIGNHTKAKHLCYLGDASIGSHVNIGAGTITCNNDGSKKHQTIIENHAYIGSNNSLVAPVTVHEKAYTGAGSVITQDVPANALAIARARQVNKKEYAKILKEQQEQHKKKNLPKKPAKKQANTKKDKDFSFVAARLIHQDINSEET